MPTRPPIFRPQGYKPAARNPTPHDGFYQSTEWRALRAAVRRRSGGICERCHDRPSRTVHHIDKSEGGTIVPIHRLMDLCPKCDNQVHAEKGQWSRP